jgi:hypothetical protein
LQPGKCFRMLRADRITSVNEYVDVENDHLCPGPSRYSSKASVQS